MSKKSSRTEFYDELQTTDNIRRVLAHRKFDTLDELANALWVRYQEKILRIVNRILFGDGRILREEIVSEVIRVIAINVWNGQFKISKQLDETIGQISRYIQGIISNKVNDELRTYYANEFRTTNDVYAQAATKITYDADPAIYINEVEWKLIEKLGKEEAKIYWMFEIDDYSIQEIADDINESESSEAIWSKLRSRLKKPAG